MVETLLGTSRVFLFGRKMEDLLLVLAEAPAKTVRLVSTTKIRPHGHPPIDGVPTAQTDRILLTKQGAADNGIYVVNNQNADWDRLPDADQPAPGETVGVQYGSPPNIGNWMRVTNNDKHFRFTRIRSGRNPQTGKNNQLGDQLDGGSFARIYGFSYDGAYYDLPRPVLFLVHGDGENVTDPAPGQNASRSPVETSITGIAAAEFQFADEIRVWSYDKADYTIRMEVDTGMFEQVLLDAFFSGGGGGATGAMVSGAMVSGAMVGGPSTRGAMVRGAMVSGAMLRGRRGGRGDPSD